MTMRDMTDLQGFREHLEATASEGTQHVYMTEVALFRDWLS